MPTPNPHSSTPAKPSGDRFRSLLLVGAPGSGKGTQGALLARIPGFHHVSSGDIFRALDKASELGRIFHQYSSKGELVPDDVTIRIWREAVRGQVAAGKFQPARHLLVLDGIPRNVNQARLLDGDIDVLLVVHLACPDEEAMVRRMQRRARMQNRFDDAREEVIRRRFDVYRRETFPILEHYGKARIRAVDATSTPAAVLRDILGHVVPAHEQHFPNALAD